MIEIIQKFDQPSSYEQPRNLGWFVMTAKRTTSSGQIQEEKPTNKPLTDNLRRLTPLEFQCQIFCGGKKCKYEGPSYWTETQMALKGIYSNWITCNILAMARPNTEQMEQFDLIGQFESQEIKAIINLQHPGEHGYCGNSLESGGFSYSPATFMNNGIFFYNFPWRDYGVASLDAILDVMKVIAFSLTEGKIAVHCHAGLGRTGVVIACYLVFSCRITGNSAIRFVRMKRPNSIQSRVQVLTVNQFEQYIWPSFTIMSTRPMGENDEFTLDEHLRRQAMIIHGYEARYYKYLPKFIHQVCEQLLWLAGLPSVATTNNRRSLHSLNRRRSFWEGFLSAAHDTPGASTSSSRHGSCEMFNFILRTPDNSVWSKATTSGSSSPQQASRSESKEKREQRGRTSTCSGSPKASCRLSRRSLKLKGKKVLKSFKKSIKSGKKPSKRSVEKSASRTSQRRAQSAGPSGQGSAHNTASSHASTGAMSSSESSGSSSPIELAQKGSRCPIRTDSKTRSVPRRTAGLSYKKHYFSLDSIPSILDEESSDDDSDEEPFVHWGRRKQALVKETEDDLMFDAATGYPLQRIVSGEESLVFNEDDEELAEFDPEEIFLGTMPTSTTFLLDVPRGIFTPKQLVAALTTNPNGLSEDMHTQIDEIAKLLNHSQRGWGALASVTDPTILVALLYTWLEQLKQPVLSRQELTRITASNFVDNPSHSLLKLSKGTRITFEYLLRFIARLNSDKEHEIVDHLLVALLQRHQDLSDINSPGTPSRNSMHEAAQFAHAILQLIKEQHES